MGEIILFRDDPHREAQLLLPWYVTGQVDPAALMRIDSHLAECAECRDDLVFERALCHAVAGHVPIPAVNEPVTPPGRIRAANDWVSWGRAAAAILVFALLVPHGAPPPPTYVALAGASDRAAGNVLLMVAPGTREHELRMILTRAGARLVDGPTAAGAYVLRVAPAARAHALVSLRQSDIVSLAQPIDAEPPS